MSDPYRDTSGLSEVISRLDELNKRLSNFAEATKKPRWREKDAFWLAVWPLFGFGVALIVASIFFGARSCAREENQTQIEVARIEAAAKGKP